jgi:hypothetical protein
MIVLTWILANPELSALALSGLLSLASGAAELAGWTKLSKILGTVTIDAGRLTRYGKLLIEARKAMNGK